MRLKIVLFGLLLGITACQSGNRYGDIKGSWRVDSTYSYYNGFDYLQREAGSDWAVYTYEADGTMKETKYGSYQSYFYEWKGPDTLVISSTRGGTPKFFEVLNLSSESLVLKKSKAPIFGGGNQERFEIRYMSRTERPSDETIPFSDPRPAGNE